jgi:hypothetical protein
MSVISLVKKLLKVEIESCKEVNRFEWEFDERRAIVCYVEWM